MTVREVDVAELVKRLKKAKASGGGGIWDGAGTFPETEWRGGVSPAAVAKWIAAAEKEAVADASGPDPLAGLSSANRKVMEARERGLEEVGTRILSHWREIARAAWLTEPDFLLWQFDDRVWGMVLRSAISLRLMPALVAGGLQRDFVKFVKDAPEDRWLRAEKRGAASMTRRKMPTGDGTNWDASWNAMVGDNTDITWIVQTCPPDEFDHWWGPASGSVSSGSGVPILMPDAVARVEQMYAAFMGRNELQTLCHFLSDRESVIQLRFGGE